MFDFLKRIKNKMGNTKLSAEQVEQVESIMDSTETSQNDVYSYRQHLEDYHPSKNGLYPDELLMLFLATKYNTADNNFPQYWRYRYNVLNPQELLTSLETRGFIQEGGLKEILMSLRVKDLKDELSANGLKVSGKKEELIDRLISNVDNAALESKYPNKPYKRTKLGEEEIKKNDYILYLHQNPVCDIGIWEMNHLLYFENPRHLRYRDILWGELVKTSLQHYGESQFGLYRNDYSYMYRHLMEENRYADAFRMLAEVLYFDLNGADNSIKLGDLSDLDDLSKFDKLDYSIELDDSSELDDLSEFDKLDYEEYKEYIQCITTLCPAAVGQWLPDMKVKLHFDSDEAYYEALLELFKDVNKRCPSHLFTPEEAAHICIWEMNNERERTLEMYKQAEDRIHELYVKRRNF